jgi:hypothetical protein
MCIEPPLPAQIAPTAGQCVRVPAVGADRVVVGAQHVGGADGDGFLAQPQVHRAVDHPLAVQCVDLLQDAAQEAHPRVELEPVIPGHGWTVSRRGRGYFVLTGLSDDPISA